MKVLMVSDAGSIHTRRWTAALKDAGVDIVLFSITPVPDDFYVKKSIKTHVCDLFRYKKNGNASGFARLSAHVEAVSLLKKVISEEKPDILHAHYATSYGLVGALTGFHPFIVSVWGSDVYEFPRQSFLKRATVEFVLKKADRVLSTSRAMAAETAKYCKGPIGITPFGVDTDLFRPGQPCRKQASLQSGPERAEDAGMVFGTVKTLSYKYGIDLLLRAFALMRQKLREVSSGENVSGHGSGTAGDARLVIAGTGPDKEKLVSLAEELGISGCVTFLGRVEHDRLPELYAGIDAAVFLSREESFGVSAVETMACAVPVIASDADGFKEVLGGGAGLIVPRENPEAAARAMAELASDRALRERLGTAGRKKAEECYRWRDNVAVMTDEYRNILTDFSTRGK